MLAKKTVHCDRKCQSSVDILRPHVLVWPLDDVADLFVPKHLLKHVKCSCRFVVVAGRIYENIFYHVIVKGAVAFQKLHPSPDLTIGPP